MGAKAEVQAVAVLFHAVKNEDAVLSTREIRRSWGMYQFITPTNLISLEFTVFHFTPS